MTLYPIQFRITNLRFLQILKSFPTLFPIIETKNGWKRIDCNVERALSRLSEENNFFLRLCTIGGRTIFSRRDNSKPDVHLHAMISRKLASRRYRPVRQLNQKPQMDDASDPYHSSGKKSPVHVHISCADFCRFRRAFECLIYTQLGL